jgi:hypothetical protein
VVSSSLTDASAWSNSTLIDGDLVEAVQAEPCTIVNTGSLGVVHALQKEDLVDEYRLLTLPRSSERASDSSRRWAGRSTGAASPRSRSAPRYWRKYERSAEHS